jgi:dCTP deaminase
VVGFRAPPRRGIDSDNIDGHDPRDFWEPLTLRRGELLLDPGEFYILRVQRRRRKSRSTVPPRWPDRSVGGRVRVHYAGFFRPRLRHRRGARRGLQRACSRSAHDTPFLLEHGQIVARLVYEPLTERPTRLYGEGGSHYQQQGLKLSKHFRPWG